jgi:polyhydroxyalkanoate synthesis regulator phasin
VAATRDACGRRSLRVPLFYEWSTAMPGFGDIVQKAFYLGVGLASYAGEKAGGKISELRSQVQKLADEMVARGEMNTDEARRFVEDMMKQAQQQPTSDPTPQKTPPSEPRRIEILEEDEEPTQKEAPATENVDKLRQQVLEMQEELKRLQRDK